MFFLKANNSSKLKEKLSFGQDLFPTLPLIGQSVFFIPKFNQSNHNLTNEGKEYEPARFSVGWVTPSPSYDRKLDQLACRHN